MVRYNKQACRLLATYLSFSFFGGRVVVQAQSTSNDGGGGGGGDSWSYLDIAIPVPLSDSSIAKMIHEGQMAIVLTGGCNSPNGNELVMEDWGEGFSCKNITSQVSIHSVQSLLFLSLSLCFCCLHTLFLYITHV